MEDKESGEIGGSDGVVGRNEDTLLQETVDYDEDGIKTRRGRKLFNEIHRN